MKRLQLICGTIILIFCLSITPITNADENEVEQKQPFSVQPILPDNQKEDVSGYYHLQVNPGDEQTVYVQLENLLDHETTVLITPVKSYTAPGGGILYKEDLESEETIILDESSTLPQHISVETEITLEPHEVIEVPVYVVVPQLESGQFLGGLLFSSKVEEVEAEETREEGVNISVTNRVTYTIAMQLDLPGDPKPEFSIGDAGIKSSHLGIELGIEMRNEAQMILRGTHGDYYVKNENGETLFSNEFEPFTMVPGTQIQFFVPWEYDTLSPGLYTVHITANVLDEVIQVEREFEILSEESKEYEEVLEDDSVAPANQGFPFPIWSIVIAAIFFILLLLLVYKMGKNNKGKKVKNNNRAERPYPGSRK